MKRLFAAVKIHPDINFIKLYKDLKSQFEQEKIRWVDLHNCHITLKFFGDTHPDQIPEIVDVLNSIALRTEAFEITLKQLGIFGSSYKPRVIWLGIDPADNLKQLGLNVLEEMDRIGFTKDRQNFIPHLTLGRIKYVENKSKLNEVVSTYSSDEVQKETIKEIFLFESILKQKGPEYKIIKSLTLKK
jgi:2'-5' RNA ligase